MASNPLTPPDSPGLQDIQKAGRAALSQQIDSDGKGPIPAAPAPPEAPPPEPVAAPAPPAPAPPPTPEAPPPADEAAPASTLNPASFSEDALYSLRQEGWQDGQPITQELINKIAERRTEFGNRLGKRGDAAAPVPEGTPAEPEPVPVEPVEEAPPPVALSEEQIDQHVREAVQQDAEAQTWVRDWNSNEAEINALNEKVGVPGKIIGSIEQDISRAEMRLTLPEIKSDETGITASEIKEEIRELKSLMRELKADRRDKQIENQDLDSRFISRTDQYRGWVRSQVEQQAQVNAFQAQASVEWDAALAKVTERYSLSAEDREELADRARDAGIAIVDRGRGDIPNMEAHIETHAKRMKASQDRHHRQRSAEYAASKTAGIQPAPATAPPEPAPAQAPQEGGLDAVYRRTRASLRQGVG
jgi:hypothetical protein